ncbi:glutamate synthase, small subunit domain protein [Anoxybacillus amylolyticus]|uniref:Glutamate synthase, small subunit domain protein n=1 Tax=Anoxybacteroides amylolyticum TaxID=294699 RepID=A0A160F5X8_9BACL|nr:glutamate synthase, small subunit domain protein [Anoxybacillus amylolyticus]
MGKATGFIEYVREEEGKRKPLSRLDDWKEYTSPFSDDTLSRQGARCMDCGTPFCHMGMERVMETIATMERSGLSNEQALFSAFEVVAKQKEAISPLEAVAK